MVAAVAILAAVGVITSCAPGNGINDVLGHGGNLPKFLFVSSQGASCCSTNNISGFKVDPNTGALTAAGNITVNFNYTGGAFFDANPAGTQLFVPEGADDKVAVLNINSGTGALTLFNEFNMPVVGSGSRFAYFAKVSPNGKWLYVSDDGCCNSGVIAGFSIAADGTLTPMSSSTFNAGYCPEGIAITPDSKFLYNVQECNEGGLLNAYSIDQTTGQLTSLSTATYNIANCPNNVNIDPTGKFLFTTSWCGGTVNGFSIAADGSLTPTSPATVDPASSTFFADVSSTQALGFVSGTFNNKVTGYTVSNAGALSSPVDTTVGSGSSYAYGLRIDPSGKFLYVAGFGDGQLYGYTIGANAALTPITGTPINTNGLGNSTTWIVITKAAF